MGTINYESKTYKWGWIVGSADLVATLYEGFNRDIPQWLLSVIGGKKAVTKALKRKKWRESEEYFDLIRIRNFDCGETDGYHELLDEVEEEFKERQIELPKFLRELR